MSSTELRYFKISEFACLCGRADCDAAPFDMETALKLDGLRLELGQPIKINSACRCSVQNTLVHGEKNSQHLLGRAVDIHSPNGIYMRRLVILAIKHGFSGIGIKKGMVHLDTRDGMSIIFGY